MAVEVTVTVVAVVADDVRGVATAGLIITVGMLLLRRLSSSLVSSTDTHSIFSPFVRFDIFFPRNIIVSTFCSDSTASAADTESPSVTAFAKPFA